MVSNCHESEYDSSTHLKMQTFEDNDDKYGFEFHCAGWDVAVMDLKFNFK